MIIISNDAKKRIAEIIFTENNLNIPNEPDQLIEFVTANAVCLYYLDKQESYEIIQEDIFNNYIHSNELLDKNKVYFYAHAWQTDARNTERRRLLYDIENKRKESLSDETQKKLIGIKKYLVSSLLNYINNNIKKDDFDFIISYDKNEYGDEIFKSISTKKEMDIKFDLTNHRELWDWLSKNPTKNNVDWPEWDFNGGNVKRVFENCFACEYNRNMIFYNNDGICNDGCIYCPFRSDKSNCLNGLLYGWLLADNDEERIEYAKIIRDLEIRIDKEIKTK